jgi:hypothetical protein
LQPLAENELRCLPEIDGTYTLFVKNLTGKAIVVTVPAMAELVDLKAAIQNHEGIPIDQQRLVFAGMQLRQDELPLVAYGIGHESMLHLLLRLRGGMYHESSGREGVNSMRRELRDVEIVTPFGRVNTQEVRACPGRTFAEQLIHFLSSR